MIFIPLFELLLFLVNVYVAIAYRATVWGWLATAFVCWFVFVAIKAIRET